MTLQQMIMNCIKLFVTLLKEMDTILKLQNRLECKINFTIPALLPNKLNTMEQGLVTSGENVRNKRAIPTLVTIQGIAAIGGMMVKGINALVDAKRASSFNNAIKLDYLAQEIGGSVPPIRGISGISVEPVGFVMMNVKVPCV